MLKLYSVDRVQVLAKLGETYKKYTYETKDPDQNVDYLTKLQLMSLNFMILRNNGQTLVKLRLRRNPMYFRADDPNL